MEELNKNHIKEVLNKDIGPTKIDSRILSLFLKQLSLLLSSGVALDESLKIIENQKIDKKLTKALSNINSDLSKGLSVYKAFLNNKSYFNPMILAFIKSGDKSGRLSEVLDNLSYYIYEDSKNKSAMKQALTYPIILLVVTIAIVAVIVSFVLPTFVGVFETSGQSLPIPTKILLSIANFFDKYGILIILVIIALIISYIILRRDKEIRLKLDRFNFLYLPFKKYRMLNLEYQFTSLLHILRMGDIELVDSMKIIKDSFKNLYIKEIIDQVVLDISHGRSLSISISSKEIFSPLFISMIKIGEDSGNMDESLKKASEYYANDYIFRMKRLGQLAEPVMILIMSLVVGFVVFSIAIPIFDSVNNISY